MMIHYPLKVVNIFSTQKLWEHLVNGEIKGYNHICIYILNLNAKLFPFFRVRQFLKVHMISYHGIRHCFILLIIAFYLS